MIRIGEVKQLMWARSDKIFLHRYHHNLDQNLLCSRSNFDVKIRSILVEKSFIGLGPGYVDSRVKYFAVNIINYSKLDVNSWNQIVENNLERFYF